MNSLGFRTDLMLRRLAGASVVDRGEYLVIRTAQNPGFYWGNFVLARVDLENAARWLSVFAAEFPEAEHVAIGLDGADAGTRLDAYRQSGLTTDVSTVLTATRLVPPRHPRPEAVLRPLERDDDWAQALALRLSIDDDVSAAHRLFCERKLAESRRLADEGHGAWFGAFVHGRMRCGLGIYADGTGPARYQSVETDPDFRGLGLSSWLVFGAGGHGLTVLGARTLVIVADPTYLAIGIYRALGFADTDRQVQVERAVSSPPS
jgi:GNAT superfamily N-acetyltransferase